MAIALRRSRVDSKFLEVLREGVVIQEIEAPFCMQRIPESFDTLEEVFHWLRETEWKLARGSAYRWIAGRSYSKGALLKKLLEKRFSEDVCERVVLELEKLGYLNDAEYFERAVETRSRKGYGARYIAMKLGMEVSAVRNIVDEKREREEIRRWVAKWRGKERHKVVQALLRRGFDGESIRKEV